MKGNLDYDIARKYLRAVLRLRDTIRIMRHPMVPIEEMQNSLKQFGYDETDHENREKTNRAVYSIRWNKVQEAWTNLEEILSEAEISWGSEAIDIQKGLDGLVRELRGVFWLFLNFKDDVKINDGNFKIIYSSLDKNDKFSLRIDDEVDRIKKFLEKYL